ncbi:bis(5'-adenosyl)-triphosphatase enpp4-like [Sycon ciliatum]|uniref:bis(5'-adenosyl)-triphosphatase enpp4-like n=1 Tax=Sycon ciliatum TaxID=27933 RepID=UPI0031F69F3D
MRLHLLGLIVCLFTWKATWSLDQIDKRTVILVSFDGFRWDYLFRGYSPALERIAASGVRVKQLKNCFPTKTFPNHYSLVTGLYPESHGIVANFMYDPRLKKHFTIGNTDPVWWNEAEPAWVTLRRRGYVTATVNWPGSDVEIRGVRPNHHNPFNSSIPFRDRVDKAISLLQLTEKERPSFIALYFEEPDFTGHTYGPNGEETMQAVKRVDDIAEYLMKRLHEIGMSNNVDVIFTSDHGMAETSDTREIFLSDYVRNSSYELVDYSPLVALLPHEGMEMELYRRLRHAHPNMTAYLKQDMPERLHYQQSRRIQPLMLLADPGWSIFAKRAAADHDRGAHGYDNDFPGVRPYFIATGPAFRRGFKMPLMNNLDIYPLVFHILGEEPPASNGTLERASRLLKRPAAAPAGNAVQLPASAGVDASSRQRMAAVLLSLGGIALLAGTMLLTTL